MVMERKASVARPPATTMGKMVAVLPTLWPLVVEDEVAGVGLVRPQFGKLGRDGGGAWVIAVDDDGFQRHRTGEGCASCGFVIARLL